MLRGQPNSLWLIGPVAAGVPRVYRAEDHDGGSSFPRASPCASLDEVGAPHEAHAHMWSTFLY